MGWLAFDGRWSGGGSGRLHGEIVDGVMGLLGRVEGSLGEVKLKLMVSFLKVNPNLEFGKLK